jgi:Tfp pilus assembly protein PilF
VTVRIATLGGVLLALLLPACASVPDTVASVSREEPAEPAIPGLDPQPFDPPMAVPSPNLLFALDPAQQAAFLRAFHDPALADVPPHQRLAAYIEQRLWQFRYDGATRTAGDALAAGEGNCLSLALVTTALARLAGVEVGYQRMRDEPVFERQGRVVLAADHVRTLLFDPGYRAGPGDVVVQEPHIVVDYFPDRRRRPGGRVTEHAVQSMYYVNLAGEAMAGERHREAYWLLRAALAQDPASAGALNSLAVLHRRVGNDAVVEAVYRHALRLHDDDLNLLGNYRALLAGQGRMGEVAELDRRLAALPVRNPYDLLERGDHAFRQQRPQLALEYYRQALERAPYLHEAYWRQAVVYAALGEPVRAEALLMTAAAEAGRPRDRRLYEAKAMALRGAERR